MPSVEQIIREDAKEHIIGGHADARSRLLKPLAYSGTLDQFKHQDLTPVIGREFEGLQVTDLLKWGDDLIRDLAITSKPSSLFAVNRCLTSCSFSAGSRLPSRPKCHTNTDERLDASHYRAVRMRTFSSLNTMHIKNGSRFCSVQSVTRLSFDFTRHILRTNTP